MPKTLRRFKHQIISRSLKQQQTMKMVEALEPDSPASDEQVFLSLAVWITLSKIPVLPESSYCPVQKKYI